VSDRPGAGGPWPLDPQVPLYGQPPATPSYPMPLAGQQPPLPHAPYEMPPGGPDQDRVPVEFGVMAVVLVAVMGLGVAVWAMTSTPKTTGASVWTAEPTARATTAPAVTPTATPSPAKVGNCSGSSAETPDWRALIPSGWTCTYEAGNEVTIVNDANDAIMVRATGTQSATVACSTDLARSATVTALPDGTWGGKVSKTTDLVYQGYAGQARCVYARGYSYVMVGMVVGGSLEQVVAGEAALAQSWVWKA